MPSTRCLKFESIGQEMVKIMGKNERARILLGERHVDDFIDSPLDHA